MERHPLLAFLNNSPSCYHAAAQMAAALEEAGYVRLREERPWTLACGGRYYLLREGSVIAFRVPRGAWRGFLLAAGHSDSPTFRVRQEVPSAGNCLRLGVEPYGGGIWRSWLDRPLTVAGRAVVRQGDSLVTRLVYVDRDLLVIPSVAIHMDREVNKGTALKPQTDLLPLFALGKEPGAFSRLIAQTLAVGEEDILSTDLFLTPRTPATLVGAAEEFVAAPRLDDLQCVFACLTGFLAAEEGESLPVLAVFNHEEVGSATRQGADSTLLSDTLERIDDALGRGEEAHRATLAESFLVSADNAHAVHPAHPEYADAAEAPVLGGGVVLKYSANQRYTTDAVSAAVFGEVCRLAGVPVQRYGNRPDLPGGSTLGNISISHLSVPSVDVGLPQLAMHSAYELACLRDTDALSRAMAVYFSRSLRRTETGIAL
ncbi:MAG: M18 family aminopeptidase [Oscillibacter sp.]|nr:M18 family aminopeptidase [Oscillibacter sp.]